MQHKTFGATKQRRNGQLYWVASTTHVDREGDRMNPALFDISSWQRNGAPLFWGHSYGAEDMIGRAVDVELTGDAFRLLPEWRKPLTPTDKMHIIADHIDRGLAKTMSIGFRPLEAPKRNEFNGNDWGRVEIYEVSLVGVAANPYASLGYARRAARINYPAIASVGLSALTAALQEEHRRGRLTQNTLFKAVPLVEQLAKIAIGV